MSSNLPLTWRLALIGAALAVLWGYSLAAALIIGLVTESVLSVLVLIAFHAGWYARAGQPVHVRLRNGNALTIALPAAVCSQLIRDWQRARTDAPMDSPLRTYELPNHVSWTVDIAAIESVSIGSPVNGLSL